MGRPYIRDGNFTIEDMQQVQYGHTHRSDRPTLAQLGIVANSTVLCQWWDWRQGQNPNAPRKVEVEGNSGIEFNAVQSFNCRSDKPTMSDTTNLNGEDL